MRAGNQGLSDGVGNTSANQPPYHLLLAIAAAFLVANLTLIGLRRSRLGDTLNSVLIGGVVSEAALVTIWAAVATEPIARRTGVTIVLCTLGFLTYLTGSYLTPQWLSEWKDHQWRSFIIGSILPKAPISAGVSFAIYEIQFVAVFITALRIHCSATRRVLCFRNSPRLHALPFQFSMQHLLLGSILVVIGIAWSSQVFDTEARIWGPDLHYVWWRFGPISFLYSVLSAVSMLVCIEMTFAQHSRRLWSAIGILAIPVLAVLGVGILKMLGANWRTMQSFLLSSVFFACFEAITTLVLLGARWMGFQLIRQIDFYGPAR